MSRAIEPTPATRVPIMIQSVFSYSLLLLVIGAVGCSSVDPRQDLADRFAKNRDEFKLLVDMMNEDASVNRVQDSLTIPLDSIDRKREAEYLRVMNDLGVRSMSRLEAQTDVTGIEMEAARSGTTIFGIVYLSNDDATSSSSYLSIDDGFSRGIVAKLDHGWYVYESDFSKLEAGLD